MNAGHGDRNTDVLRQVRECARVPEHSLPLMQAVSGGRGFCAGRHLFFAAENWLVAIGYPLRGRWDPADFLADLEQARQRTGAGEFYAIGPDMPEDLPATVLERDRFYVLAADAPVPGRLISPVRKAAGLLSVDEGTGFGPAHRRLWAEFLARRQGAMNSRVAELYARVPDALQQPDTPLRLLSARDAAGNVAACLLLDYWPDNFVSYILGAHSRQHYTPHAMDLLFARMLESARRRGKRFVQLGLGVNPGVLRFKLKWGAKPALPFVMAQWEEKARPDDDSVTHALALAMLRGGGKVRLPESPPTRPYAMLWEISRGGARSWLGGTAHFFSHSFEPSFRKLFAHVDNVIFEGPLDSDFMSRARQAGLELPPDYTPIINLLEEDEIRKLENMVYGPRGGIARALGMAVKPRVDVREVLATGLPWYAFFTLWTAFLERKGWRESVDMEAWRVARSMGRNVIAMENLEEQMESLGSLPIERVLGFFRNCHTWPARARRNQRAYLAGDLEKMMGSSAEFPTRTEHVVGRRDQRFRERMRPYLEQGRAAVFVGTAHLVNLRHMLAEDGFGVRQAPFGLRPKIQAALRGILRPDKGVKW